MGNSIQQVFIDMVTSLWLLVVQVALARTWNSLCTPKKVTLLVIPPNTARQYVQVGIAKCIIIVKNYGNCEIETARFWTKSQKFPAIQNH